MKDTPYLEPLAESRWKFGLPPGEYYEGMTDDYEVYYSPGGMVWHREREKVTTKQQ